MASVNKVILVGNVGRAPEGKDTTGGMMATFSLATEERVKEEKKTIWHNVVCFGKTADAVLQYVHGGSQIFVEGRIETTKYQTADGQDRWSTKIVANNVQFLGKKDTQQTASDSAPAVKLDGKAATAVSAADSSFKDDGDIPS